MCRPIVFVKYWDKGSTAIGADQMVVALQGLGLLARAIYAHELSTVHDSVVVFIKRADLAHLLGAGLRGNLRVLDVQDSVVFRHWISHWMFYDGFIFRNQRQRCDFAPRRAVSRTIPQHWDSRYRPQCSGSSVLRAAYLGTARSISSWGQIPGLDCLGPEDWFERALAYNAHVSVRENRREWLYKPNAKVVTAAACRAVLITTRDCSAVEHLGEDYPFYLDGSDVASITAGLSRARELVGGPEWEVALARLDTVRIANSIEQVAQRYLALFAELERSETGPNPAVVATSLQRPVRRVG